MMWIMEETLRQHLATCAAAFEAATGLVPSVASRRAVQDSRYLERVIGGTGFTVATYDRLMAYFSAHWPEDLDWPHECGPRPDRGEWARIEAERHAKRSASSQPEAA